jgi:hypothetical protein
VNTAGTSVISGMGNLPAASFVCFWRRWREFRHTGCDRSTASAVLAATAAWARQLDLTLRTALVPVSAISEQGDGERRFGRRSMCRMRCSRGGLAWADAR